MGIAYLNGVVLFLQTIMGNTGPTTWLCLFMSICLVINNDGLAQRINGVVEINAGFTRHVSRDGAKAL